jgi:small subunit ribosomal protein S1
VVTFGAFVEILDGVEGLVHISELAPHHVESPREVVHPGDTIRVRILEIDSERRRLSLSAKRVEDQILPVSRPPKDDAEQAAEQQEQPAVAAAQTADPAPDAEGGGDDVDAHVQGAGEAQAAAEPDASGAEAQAEQAAAEPDAGVAEAQAEQAAAEPDASGAEPDAGVAEAQAEQAAAEPDASGAEAQAQAADDQAQTAEPTEPVDTEPQASGEPVPDAPPVESPRD